MQQHDNTSHGKDLVPYIEPVTPPRKVRHYSDFEKHCIVEYIVEELENDSNVVKAAKDCNVDTRNFYNWLPKFPDLAQRFDQARETELKHTYEKVMEIERRMLLNPKLDPDWLHGEQARSILNSMFWRLERLQRQRFGREVKHTIGIEDYEQKLADAKKRLLHTLPGEVLDHVP